MNLTSRRLPFKGLEFKERGANYSGGYDKKQNYNITNDKFFKLVNLFTFFYAIFISSSSSIAFCETQSLIHLQKPLHQTTF